ncbi:3-deoxy-manno-octulosonate cytidylyltransferase [Frateuria terrea]|uniref:3-deoxy-manno-octulosonate cytidylyltransferase n=1 Tax=Frateuria terrea TaxID=529704 RepID=A0A1H6Q8G1_9GAMM|nr:3-deoxy-manno-octulosonate cytidylyltransferase [Frateuria terrea]SEI38146.1 3-deoxy-manno-octulosonate cytidylyltransferase (CMP-KDO synthetase) [Frateuria terrea]SFP03697.1 3-deoxy-manno-octulosonate cytidylyltransferase (CMP-KDO synthetase) [Frateuria terrea]
MPAVPSFIVAIPARYGSTRLPAKPLRDLGGVPMVVRVAQRALQAGAGQVVVAVDDTRVAEALAGQGVDICMTRPDHASGSDRLAEVAAHYGWADDAVVVNLQGDEPFAPAAGIREVARALAEDDAPMATLATPVTDAHELFDPNVVKLVRGANGRALYFSRAPLPWARDAFAIGRDALPESVPFLRHIGIYAYRAGFLARYTGLSRTPLERAESLEQLRVLEHGYPIAVRLTPEPFPPGIDTEADVERAERWLATQR